MNAREASRQHGRLETLQFDNSLIDGATVSADGRIVLAAWGIGRLLILAPNGDLIGQILTPALRPTSVRFGGPNLDQILVTTEVITDRGDDLSDCGVYLGTCPIVGRRPHELVLSYTR